MTIIHRKETPLAYGGTVTASAHFGADFGGVHASVLTTVCAANCTTTAHLTAEGARAYATALLACADAADAALSHISEAA